MSPGILLLALLLQASTASAEATPASPGFLAQVRAATDRYHDREAAVLDGYRLIGDDFPGMGEHWVHIGRLFDAEYDPARPEFLSYVPVDGVPRLVGVAYGLPLLDGEQPPDAPAGRHAWHDHRGKLDDETFVPHHHMAGHGGGGPRLAMVHAWIWLANPDGMFAADNWAIPYVRLGLDPPAEPNSAAGKAASLLSGGDAHVARIVEAAILEAGGPGGAPRIPEAIRRARRRADDVLAGRMGGTRVGTAEVNRLQDVWQGLWDDVEAAVDARTRERLRAQSMR